MTAVRLTDVVKEWTAGPTSVRALRGVSLEVERGEKLVLLGKSGSGKSTLLHLLGGLDRPTSGHIKVEGRELTELSGAELARYRLETVGMVFQSFHLVPWRTAVDNVALPLVFAGMDPVLRQERAEATLQAVGLGHRLRHRPAELSGGERQRVAIARALINRPTLLLADEPTGNLDSSNTRDVLRLLRRAHAGGQAILMVTHDARVASLADRVINLFDGMVADDARIVPIPRRVNGVGDIVELRG